MEKVDLTLRVGSCDEHRCARLSGVFVCTSFFLVIWLFMSLRIFPEIETQTKPTTAWIRVGYTRVYVLLVLGRGGIGAETGTFPRTQCWKIQ